MWNYMCIRWLINWSDSTKMHGATIRFTFSLWKSYLKYFFYSAAYLFSFFLYFLHFLHLFISSLSFRFLSDPRMSCSALVTALLWRKTTKCCMSDTKFTLGRFPWSNNAAASLRRQVTENHRLDIPETWAQDCNKSASNVSFLAAVTNADCKPKIAVLPLI